ncbi:alpha/beta hydrolase [Sphingobium sp. Sx8-8]|uniref:alpha/beta hydrolase n=1 Tax=Sphingobium sp. Sx8-8 TaxID=2933617 RepID=UPI001F55C4C8|nr:alpha/beta hydrolase [Sphingobium sp. Sx8-8]
MDQQITSSGSDQELDDLVVHVRSVFDSFDENTTIDEMRAGWESLFEGTVPVVGASARRIETEDFKGEWIVAPGADEDRAVIYLHGGGYVIGSVQSYRDMCERLSRASRAAVLAVDYRLAPEHPFPAAVDDAVSAYRWVLAQGIKPGRVAVAGDSAGGALTFAVMFTARAEGLPLPACGVPISPWVDLEHTGQTMITMDAVEPMCHKTVLEGCAQLYLPDGDLRNPLASSVHGDFSGLPPLFVTVGGHETLLDDAYRTVTLAEAADVPVTLKVYDRQIHVFQIFASRMAAAEQAIGDIGDFIIEHTS